MLKQRWMRCLGQVVRMEDDRMPKELIHEELSQGTSATGRLLLRFNDVCKRDLKALQINTQTEEATASNIADRLWTKGSGPYQRLLVFLCAVATACILPTHFMGGAFTLYTTKTKKENNTGGKEVMGAEKETRLAFQLTTDISRSFFRSGYAVCRSIPSYCVAWLRS